MRLRAFATLGVLVFIVLTAVDASGVPIPQLALFFATVAVLTTASAVTYLLRRGRSQ